MDLAGAGLGGGVDITYAEATILHIVRMQDRPKSLTTIARLLNRDDTPNIQYGLRKLSKAGLIAKTRDPARKTFLYSATELGVRVTDAYAEIRREVLVPLTDAIESAEERMQGAADFLQIMTGLYDAAGRVAATYQQDRPNANSRHGAARPGREGARPAARPNDPRHPRHRRHRAPRRGRLERGRLPATARSRRRGYRCRAGQTASTLPALRRARGRER